MVIDDDLLAGIPALDDFASPFREVVDPQPRNLLVEEILALPYSKSCGRSLPELLRVILDGEISSGNCAWWLAGGEGPAITESLHRGLIENGWRCAYIAADPHRRRYFPPGLDGQAATDADIAGFNHLLAQHFTAEVSRDDA